MHRSIHLALLLLGTGLGLGAHADQDETRREQFETAQIGSSGEAREEIDIDDARGAGPDEPVERAEQHEVSRGPDEVSRGPDEVSRGLDEVPRDLDAQREHHAEHDEEQQAPSEEHAADDEPAARQLPVASLAFELTSSGGSRGEGAFETLLRFTRGDLEAALGFGASAGTLSPARPWLRAMAALQLDPLRWEAALLWQPAQSGATRSELELGASGGWPRAARTEETGPDQEAPSWTATVRALELELAPGAAGIARSARTLTAMQLSGAALSVDAEHPLATHLSWSARLGAGLWTLAVPQGIPARLSLSPWERLGQHALSWPARAEGAFGMLVSVGGARVGLSASAGLPAAQGAFESALELSAERAFGPAQLQLTVGCAHLWPGDLWLGSLGLGVRWRLLGEPS